MSTPKTPKIGAELSKCAFALLSQHKHWYLFPLLCDLCILTAFAVVAVPSARFEIQLWTNAIQLTVSLYFIILLVVMIFFFLIHTIFLFFNTALTNCVLQYFYQQPSSFKVGIYAGCRNIWRSICWRTFTSSVFMIILQCEYWMDNWFETQFAKNVMQRLPWYLAFQLAIPAMIAEKIGAYAALKRSATLIRETWGKEGMPLRSHLNAGVRLPMLLLRLGSLAPIVVAMLIGGDTVIIAGSALTVMLFSSTTVLYGATRTVITTAMYLHAIGMDVSKFCTNEMIQRVFSPATRKRPSENKEAGI